MPSRATITDRASSAKTSPSSWLTASACLSLNWSIESASVCGKDFSAASAWVASLSGSTPSSPAAITNARFLESHWDASVPAVRMIGAVRPAWFLNVPATL